MDSRSIGTLDIFDELAGGSRWWAAIGKHPSSAAIITTKLPWNSRNKTITSSHRGKPNPTVDNDSAETNRVLSDASRKTLIFAPPSSRVRAWHAGDGPAPSRLKIVFSSYFQYPVVRSEGGSKHNNKARALQRFPVSQRLPAFAFWCAKAGYLATGKLLPATGVPRMTSRAFPLFCPGLSGPSLEDRV